MSYFKDRILTPLLALAACMVLGCPPAHGAERVGPPSPGCGLSLQCLKSATMKMAIALTAVPGRFLPEPALVEATLAQGLTAGSVGNHFVDELTFRDHNALALRLRKLQELSLLTLWENKSAKLYLGVSRDGVAGINLRQKRPAPVERREQSVRLAERPTVHDPYQVAPIFAQGQ